jgi:predicted CopG family antitoxin
MKIKDIEFDTVGNWNNNITVSPKAWKYIKELKEENEMFKDVIKFLISKTTKDWWIYRAVKNVIKQKTGKSIEDIINE